MFWEGRVEDGEVVAFAVDIWRRRAEIKPVPFHIITVIVFGAELGLEGIFFEVPTSWR